jgi:hypothetical protein
MVSCPRATQFKDLDSKFQNGTSSSKSREKLCLVSCLRGGSSLLVSVLRGNDTLSSVSFASSITPSRALTHFHHGSAPSHSTSPLKRASAITLSATRSNRVRSCSISRRSSVNLFLMASFLSIVQFELSTKLSN